jgi:ABC-type Zn uptake system ZnuABC Zn-binding protein ZnuA
MRLSRRLMRLDINGSVCSAVVAIASVIVLLAACSGPGTGTSPGTSASASALKVVTTTTVFADIVQKVGGDRVVATSIIPPGVGPEDYEPKPGDAQLLSEARLIVSNGVGLDDFLNKLLQSGAGGTTPRLVLGDGIPTIDIDGQPNPHFWLDPSLVKQYYVPEISAKLNELDPAGAATFNANATAYAGKLDALDTELAGMVAQIPPQNRKLVTFHDAFPYLARHYGFELIGVILPNVGQEPSASELAALVEKVKAAGVKAVFSEAQFSPKLAQTLADEAGITKVVTTLYNDALGPPPADTYLGMMRYDMEQIVQALQ